MIFNVYDVARAIFKGNQRLKIERTKKSWNELTSAQRTNYLALAGQVLIDIHAPFDVHDHANHS